MIVLTVWNEAKKDFDIMAFPASRILSVRKEVGGSFNCLVDVYCYDDRPSYKSFYVKESFEEIIAQFNNKSFF